MRIPPKVQVIILWLYICLAMVVAMMIGGMTPLSSPQAESDSDSKRARVRRPAPVPPKPAGEYSRVHS